MRDWRGVYAVILFIFFWTFLGFAVRAVQLRRPGVPAIPRHVFGFMAHLFHPDRFSERGLRARRIAIVAFVGLAAFVALGFLVF